MPKKKRESGKRTSVKVGNISDVSGNVTIGGSSLSGHSTTDAPPPKITMGSRAAEFEYLFAPLYAMIDARLETSIADKEDLKTEVKKIQTTIFEAAENNGKVDQLLLSRRFRNIARMAPDVFDVIVMILMNPMAEVSLVIRKMVQKAKIES